MLNFAYFQFNGSSFSVHSNLEFHMFDQSLQNAIPLLLQRGDPVSRNRYSSVFFLFLAEICDVNSVESDRANFFPILLCLYSFKPHEFVVLFLIELHLLVKTLECNLPLSGFNLNNNQIRNTPLIILLAYHFILLILISF